jgi:hypothetical protein
MSGRGENMRHKILLGGGTNVGKSLALIQLAVSFPNNQVHIYDTEGEINNLLEEYGLDLPNLSVFQVTPDWEKLESDYHTSKEILKEGDWLSIDMMGVLWDLAQNYYSKQVFGESPAQHIITLREQAKRTDFGGFDGLTDWTVIKRMHNEDIVDDAVRWSPFNVMATTSLTEFSPKVKVPQTGVEGLMVKEFGMKLEGEKHNIYRFRTVAILYQKPEVAKFFYKVVKEKGDIMRTPLPEVDFTGVSFIDRYLRRI